jgi:hypothetical protein
MGSELPNDLHRNGSIPLLFANNLNWLGGATGESYREGVHSLGREGGLMGFSSHYSAVLFLGRLRRRRAA